MLAGAKIYETLSLMPMSVSLDSFRETSIRCVKESCLSCQSGLQSLFSIEKYIFSSLSRPHNFSTACTNWACSTLDLTTLQAKNVFQSISSTIFRCKIFVERATWRIASLAKRVKTQILNSTRQLSYCAQFIISGWSEQSNTKTLMRWNFLVIEVNWISIIVSV